MPVGYVQIPVGIAGPLLLDGFEYWVPMATTEGCLVASTNRGCKAIHACGGAASMLLRDAMTRAPVVRFGSAKRASDLKFFLEDPINFDTLSVVFNRSGLFSGFHFLPSLWFFFFFLLIFWLLKLSIDASDWFVCIYGSLFCLTWVLICLIESF
jgi:hypothetical protein